MLIVRMVLTCIALIVMFISEYFLVLTVYFYHIRTIITIERSLSLSRFSIFAFGCMVQPKQTGIIIVYKNPKNQAAKVSTRFYILLFVPPITNYGKSLGQVTRMPLLSI